MFKSLNKPRSWFLKIATLLRKVKKRGNKKRRFNPVAINSILNSILKEKMTSRHNIYYYHWPRRKRKFEETNYQDFKSWLKIYSSKQSKIQMGSQVSNKPLFVPCPSLITQPHCLILPWIIVKIVLFFEFYLLVFYFKNQLIDQETTIMIVL